MAWRESIEVPPVRHGQNPIPFASRVGNMLFTGGIMGADPETGQVPESIDQQVANCFALLKKTVEKAGGTLEDVGFVTVFIKDPATRAKVNPVWLQHFPDEHSRPARHTIVQENLNYQVQIEAIAVLKPQGGA